MPRTLFTALIATTVLATAESPRAALSGRLVVLAAENRLLIIDVASRETVADSQLAPDQTSLWGSPGVGGADGRAYVPLWRTGTREAQIVEVGGAGNAMRRVTTVDDVDGPPWLDVGQRSGHLYLISGNGDRVQVFDPKSGTLIRRFSVPQTGQSFGGSHTDAYAAAISADEHRLYVSYHGTHRSGIDWFTLSESTLIPCSPVPNSIGCIRSHGFFATVGNGLVADLSDNHGLREMDSVGTELSTSDIGLPGNHMVSFALDTVGNIAYSLGDCGYTGGLSATPLHGTGTRWRLPDKRTCGTTIRLSSDRSWLAIPSYPRGVLGPYEIAIVDARTGQTLETIAVRYAIHDLIAIR